MKKTLTCLNQHIPVSHEHRSGWVFFLFRCRFLFFRLSYMNTDVKVKMQNPSVCDCVPDQNPLIFRPVALKKIINNNHKGKHMFCVWKIHCLNTEENAKHQWLYLLSLNKKCNLRALCSDYSFKNVFILLLVKILLCFNMQQGNAIFYPLLISLPACGRSNIDQLERTPPDNP